MTDSRVLKKNELDFPTLLEKFKSDLPEEVGAIGSFIGIVREKAKKNGEVEKLHYESAESVDEELEIIASDFEEDVEGISKVSICHVVDDLNPGEDIVYVLVAGYHREEVFEVLPKIMDRVKSEVHIWKKEITKDNDYWVHEVKD